MVNSEGSYYPVSFLQGLKKVINAFLRAQNQTQYLNFQFFAYSICFRQDDKRQATSDSHYKISYRQRIYIRAVEVLVCENIGELN